MKTIKKKSSLRLFDFQQFLLQYSPIFKLINRKSKQVFALNFGCLIFEPNFGMYRVTFLFKASITSFQDFEIAKVFSALIDSESWKVVVFVIVYSIVFAFRFLSMHRRTTTLLLHCITFQPVYSVLPFFN